jgi:DNA polymerase III subunit delta
MVGDLVGLTLIQGGESILADRAIAAIIASRSGATVTQLDCAEIELGAITDALAPSLFGEDRIIVLREIQELAQELQEEITEYLTNSDESVHLVLWHKGGVKGKALLDKVKKLKPEIVQADTIKKDGDKAQFVHVEFARAGRKVTVDAVQALVDALGSDLRELSGAISQLASDTTAGKTIDSDDVEKFQRGRVETTGYDVADATLDGKTDIALITLRQALESGVDPVLITSALASSIRTLAKVSGASRGVKSFELASSLGLPPWQIDKARRQLQGWSPATLSAAVVTLAQADADIKGASADPGYALERCILDIARERAARSA